MSAQAMTFALKPCPFCGGPAELWRARPENPKLPAWVACKGRCVVLTREHDTDEEAIQTWNTRAATAAEAEAARLLPWARLGSAIMQDYPEYGSLDGFDIQDLAEAAGVLVKINGGFDPEKHHDITGEADPGSEWYEMLGRPDALAAERKP